MAGARITLLSRPGCHLCDDARAVIERVAADLDAGWEERDITASPDDLAEYWDKIPVTFVDGIQIDFWRISESRLRAALSRQDDAARLASASGRWAPQAMRDPRGSLRQPSPPMGHVAPTIPLRYPPRTPRNPATL
jgi:hypothetical protein